MAFICRLKDWVAKQAEREQEAEDRKKKKLEKLKQEYHHVFHDPEYNKERAEVTDKVYESIEEGIAAASASVQDMPKKRSATEQTHESSKKLKKTALWYIMSSFL